MREAGHGKADGAAQIQERTTQSLRDVKGAGAQAESSARGGERAERAWQYLRCVQTFAKRERLAGDSAWPGRARPRDTRDDKQAHARPGARRVQGCEQRRDREETLAWMRRNTEKGFLHAHRALRDWYRVQKPLVTRLRAACETGAEELQLWAEPEAHSLWTLPQICRLSEALERGL